MANIGGTTGWDTADIVTPPTMIRQRRKTAIGRLQLRPTTLGGGTWTVQRSYDGKTSRAVRQALAPKISVNQFKKVLTEQIETVRTQYGFDAATEQGHGFAFQYFAGQLILDTEPGFEGDIVDMALFSKDLGTDLVLEDEANTLLRICQCKYVTPQRPVNDQEVNDFFNRHTHYMDRGWVQQHGSEYAASALADYSERLRDGWKIEYWFVTTGTANPKVLEMVSHANADYIDRELPIRCEMYDFSALKDYYVRSLSLEESIPAQVELDLPTDQFFEKDDPYTTLIAVLKGNSLRNLYKQHKQALYAYNIRGYLGNRGINQAISETARDHPGDFFYFNNGVSAICTQYDLHGNKLIAKKFQIINGAQTVSSLASQEPNSDIDVLFRLTVTSSVATDKGINSDIIKNNNSQNVIKLSDFRANDRIQLFLEQKLRSHRAKGALPAFHYFRKRSVGRKGLGQGLRLEDLAKIRYAVYSEPTLIHANPKALWTLAEDGGVYETAFGVEGVLEDAWSNETVNKTLLGIALYFRLAQDTRELGRRDKDVRFLYRLRFHALSLAGEHYLRKEPDAIQDLINDGSLFSDSYAAFWRVARSVLLHVEMMAEGDDQTMFAFLRSSERWEQMRKLFRREILVQ